MGQIYAKIKYGSWVSPGGIPEPNTLDYITQNVAKATPPRRKRPLGLEILFNGTNVNVSVTTQVYGSYTTFYTIGSNTFYDKQLVSPAVQSPPADQQSVDSGEWSNLLRGRLLDQSVNLAQAFAERKQAATMFADFGGRILKAYKALRKADVRGVYRALSGGKDLPRGWKKKFSHASQQLGDHWLAWQYGIRPLISDIAGSVAEIYKVRAVQPLIRRVSASSKSKGWSSQTTPSNPSYSTIRARAICYAEFDSGAAAFDQTAQRLGLTDPIMLAWELIPYSFVIDWFLNVGDFIHASGTVSGLKRVGVHVSTRYELGASNTHPSYGGLAFYIYVSKSRTFSTSVPGPTLRWSSKPFGKLDEGQFSRIYSALALARQPLGTSSLPGKKG